MGERDGNKIIAVIGTPLVLNCSSMRDMTRMTQAYVPWLVDMCHDSQDSGATTHLSDNALHPECAKSVVFEKQQTYFSWSRTYSARKPY